MQKSTQNMHERETNDECFYKEIKPRRNRNSQVL